MFSGTFGGPGVHQPTCFELVMAFDVKALNIYVFSYVEGRKEVGRRLKKLMTGTSLGFRCCVT